MMTLAILELLCEEYKDCFGEVSNRQGFTTGRSHCLVRRKNRAKAPIGQSYLTGRQ
jgi:hypothetical protein